MNTKKIQLAVLTIFLAAALVSSVATFGVSNVQASEDRDHEKEKKHDGKDRDHDKKKMKHNDYDDKKEKKHYDKKGNNNHASQSINQNQVSKQNSQCVSGTFTALSCNNVGLQFQNNDGNLALGQQ